MYLCPDYVVSSTPHIDIDSVSSDCSVRNVITFRELIEALTKLIELNKELVMTRVCTQKVPGIITSSCEANTLLPDKSNILAVIRLLETLISLYPEEPITGIDEEKGEEFDVFGEEQVKKVKQLKERLGEIEYMVAQL